MPSEALASIIEFFRAVPRNPHEDLTTRRASTDQLMGSMPTAADVEVEAVEAGGVPAERISATSADPDRWLLYLHGGGYVAGSLTSHRPHAARLSAEVGCVVLNVAYRLAPEHPFPAAVDDAVTAYRWLTQFAEPTRIALAGDSAGGGLAVATLIALRDAGVARPAAAALISPWTDLTMTASSYDSRRDADPVLDRARLIEQATMYLAGADPKTPLASPLYADLAGLPPLLVQVGDAEILLDDSVEFGERARAAGVDCTVEVTPDAIHIWHVMADLAPEGAAAVARLAGWLRPHIGLNTPVEQALPWHDHRPPQ
jgi:acetyl esterase/lipase